MEGKTAKLDGNVAPRREAQQDTGKRRKERQKNREEENSAIHSADEVASDVNMRRGKHEDAEK